MTYREQCEKVAADAREAGLPVLGLIDEAYGWAPGVILDVSFTHSGAVAFAREHGYSCAPLQSAKRNAIIEMKRGACSWVRVGR